MVELQTPPMNSVFHALGDATRRHMLRDLAGGERTVSQLAQPFAISLAAASKHIKVLESAGLIRRARICAGSIPGRSPAPMSG
jgi:DNA-binding transcriptional ArsR family regulator